LPIFRINPSSLLHCLLFHPTYFQWDFMYWCKNEKVKTSLNKMLILVKQYKKNIIQSNSAIAYKECYTKELQNAMQVKQWHFSLKSNYFRARLKFSLPLKSSSTKKYFTTLTVNSNIHFVTFYIYKFILNSFLIKTNRFKINSNFYHCKKKKLSP
jgi:hypothetical protein